MTLQHDHACPDCAGRGHVWILPEEAGWRVMDIMGGRTRWMAKGGGIHTFSPGHERLMRQCACVVPASYPL
jgi:hypothetical protein